MPGIDWTFVADLEGEAVLQGYVPKNRFGEPIGQSGVTIATGIDIGQFDAKTLKNLFKPAKVIPYQLLLKLGYYIGLKGKAATVALYRAPLIITEEEAHLLDSLMYERELRRLRRVWEQSTNSLFDALPSQVQTVLFSLAWNFGANLSEALPNTWKAFVNSYAENNWDIAYNAMATFKSKNPELKTRRAKEARLLNTLLNDFT